ncbi:MAG TPA: NADH-quinone oxidoreductase subunit H [Polyangiaceae bacterium]
MPIAEVAVHLLLLLLLPPLLLGIIVKTKAVFAGRAGAPLLQPYYDLAKLMRKGLVLSTTTSWIFRVAPVVGFITALLAGLLIPLGYHRAPIAFAGDLVLFAYLFGLGRFFTVLAALDTGSSFEGMGATREATFSCLAEPALFLSLLVLVKRAGSLSLSGMLGGALAGKWQGAPAALVLVVVSLFIVVLAENSRIPIDDPNTHLELTMIHEVMVLDHGGPLLGIILYGAAIKLFVLGAVVVRTAIPFGMGNPWGDWSLFVLGMLAFSAVVGTIESIMARLQLRHVPSLLVAACLLSAFGIILLAR